MESAEFKQFFPYLSKPSEEEIFWGMALKGTFLPEFLK